MVSAHHLPDGESGQLLTLVIETAPDGIVIIDADARIKSFSPAAERLFGFREDEVLDKNVSILMPFPYERAHDGYMKRYMETGERRIIGIGREVSGRRKDGSVFPVELAVGEVTIGGVRLFTGFLRDISQRRTAEKRITELQNELVHVARFSALGELASALAHELNQPLTAIANYAQAARQLCAKSADVNAGRATELMTKAVDQAQRAGQVIRRLRQFVKHHDVERRWEDAADATREAVQIAAIGTQTKRITIAVESPPNLPLVFIDRIQIQQVITNLVRNAVDALSQWPGERTVQVGLKVAEGDRLWVTVEDNGPGLAPQVSGRLFEPFTTTKADGVGIGLAVSRTIIEAHDGRIWGENRPGGGAVFGFSLPLGAREEDAA